MVLPGLWDYPTQEGEEVVKAKCEGCTCEVMPCGHKEHDQFVPYMPDAWGTITTYCIKCKKVS